MASHRFRFLTVVWGKAYTDAYLNVVLRSQLSPGNLPVFAKHSDSVYTIYTTEADIERCRASEMFQRLREVMQVEFAVIRKNRFVSKYNLMTQCHAHGIRSARGEECGFVLLTPDVVWSDGSFGRLLELAASPSPMIMMATMPRVVKETFLPAYAERLNGADALPPRELVSVALQHIHPVTQSCLWDDPNRTGAGPGDFLWRVGDDGLLLRAFQLQPLLIRPVDRDAVPEIAIDADYPSRICPNPADALIIDDSDDVCAVDFTTIADAPTLVLRGYETMEGTVKWAETNADALHRSLLRRTIRIHTRDLSDAWAVAERRSDEVVTEILTRLEGVDRQTSAQPSRLSRWRYLSPRFLAAKCRDRGPRDFFRTSVARVAAPLGRLTGWDRVRVTSFRA
jgi:hypothetical protein